jgi:hypothetical protein
MAKPRLDQRGQIFFRIAKFYKKFIKDFSALAKPLIDLLKKEVLFEWKDDQ